MVNAVNISQRTIAPGQPCFIIGEAGVNHNGHYDMALQLIDAAAAAGVDAVKFQTFKSEEVISPAAPKAAYQVRNTGEEESQLEMVKKLELPPQAFRDLSAYCHRKGILFLSTPFDFSSVDLLDDIGVPAFKIASGEITNFPFLRHIARTGKPIILSTGMSTMLEVSVAVNLLAESGVRELVLLHCTSNYPASPESVNLRAMRAMEDTFHVPIGYSDHTEGIAIPIAAAALGACVLEKHFTLDRNLPGPDHRASLEPSELKEMVLSVRKVEAALGTGEKKPTSEELNTAAVARRSLVAARSLTAGTVISEDMIVIRRPGTGLPPSMLPSVLGRRLKTGIDAGTLLTLEMLD